MEKLRRERVRGSIMVMGVQGGSSLAAWSREIAESRTRIPVSPWLVMGNSRSANAAQKNAPHSFKRYHEADLGSLNTLGADYLGEY